MHNRLGQSDSLKVEGCRTQPVQSGLISVDFQEEVREKVISEEVRLELLRWFGSN